MIPSAKAERPRSVLAQQRSLRTRAKLVEAAASLSRSRHFDVISVGDICEKAGVAKGSYYFYFERKEDLLLLVAGYALNALAVEITRPEHDDIHVAKSLKLGLDALARRAETFPRRFVQRTIVELYRSVDRMGPAEDVGSMRNVFDARIKRARKKGELRSGHSSKELAAALTGVVLHTLWLWSIDRLPGRASLAGALRAGADIVFDGALTPS